MLNQKCIIISDVHNRTVQVENILTKVLHDKAVILGDEFDSWGDSLELTKRTAEWIKESINNPKRVHLFGNHTLSYCYPANQHLYCSGFTRQKSQLINSIISREDWDKVKPYYVEQGWLLSHAGLSLGKFKQLAPSLSPKNYNLTNIKSILDKEYNGYVERGELNYRYCSLFGCGYNRGGNDKHGGITWEDFGSYTPIRNVKMILGHSILNNPVIKYYDHTEYGILKENLFCNKEERVAFKYIPDDEIKPYGKVSNTEVGCGVCLDTNNRHYAILENGELSIFSNY